MTTVNEPRRVAGPVKVDVYALVDDYQRDDLVTVRDRAETWRVVSKYDPRGIGPSLEAISCVPVVLCEPVSPGSKMTTPANYGLGLWIEPRDLRHKELDDSAEAA